MKILLGAVLCLFLVGCTSAPKLEYPTGNKLLRQPINVLKPAATVTAPSKGAPVDLNPEINHLSPENQNSSTRHDS